MQWAVHLSSHTGTWFVTCVRARDEMCGRVAQGYFVAMNTRRFPPPWSIDELEACFVVIDSAGQSWPMSISRRSRGLDQSAVVPIVASAPLLLLRTSANLYASCF
jgi:hypothetical protein